MEQALFEVKVHQNVDRKFHTFDETISDEPASSARDGSRTTRWSRTSRAVASPKTSSSDDTSYRLTDGIASAWMRGPAFLQELGSR